MTFSILLFAYLFSQFFRSFLTIIAADLTRDLGFDAAQLGWVGSSWFIAFALSQFIVGYLLDTVGPRRTMAGMMLAGMLGALVFALSNGFVMSVVGMALIGVGCSPMLMTGLYIFGRTEPPARFAALSSMLVGFGNIGNLVAATPLAWSAQTFGWRISMAVVGLAMGLAVALVWAMLRDPPRAERADGAKANALSDLLDVLRIRALWLVLPIHLFGYAAVATERGLWVGPFLDKVHGLDSISRGNVVFLMSVAMALGALACGPATRWFRETKRPAVIGNAVTAALLLTLGFAPSLGAGAASVLLVGVGFFGLTYSLLLSHGRPFFPDHLLGRGVTFLNFLAIGGAGLMQAMTGQAMNALLAAGASQPDAFAVIHIAIGLSVAVALVPFMLARKAP
ncbi:MAG: MFS transporter [Beijerinckiaceae bacterium]